MSTTRKATREANPTAPEGLATTMFRASFGRKVLAGVLGGVAGGAVFGMMMALMGMLPMLASMVGSESAIVGFLIHMMISILIGVGLTVVAANRFLTSYGRAALTGLAYGALWWVLGPLVLMPLMLGAELFVLNVGAMMSLMGHMVFGVILGLVATRVLARRR